MQKSGALDGTMAERVLPRGKVWVGLGPDAAQQISKYDGTRSVVQVFFPFFPSS